MDTAKIGPNDPDYVAMAPGEMLTALADDAMAWGTAFAQHAKRNGTEIDASWAASWFANAIETSWDVRTRRAQPPTKPHLSNVR